MRGDPLALKVGTRAVRDRLRRDRDAARRASRTRSLPTNPYRAWIAEYAGARLPGGRRERRGRTSDRLAERYATPAREAELIRNLQGSDPARGRFLGDGLLRRRHTGHVLTRAGAGGCPHLGRLHQRRHGARRVRLGRAGRLHARPDRGRADRSGHRTPAVIVEAPVNGTDEAQHPLQRLAVPAHPRARRARHPAVPGGDRRGGARLRRVLPLPAPAPASTRRCRAVERLRGAMRRAARRAGGGSCSASARAGAARSRPPPRSGALPTEEYLERCDPWPLNPRRRVAARRQAGKPGGRGQLRGDPGRAGPRLRRAWPRRPRAIARLRTVPRDPYPAEMREAREKVFAACRANGVAFLEGARPKRSPRRSTKACASSPARARLRRGGGGGIRGGR